MNIAKTAVLDGEDMNNVSKRGYLHENYRLFHSTDRRDMDFEMHSHDFHKIVLCLSGRVTYIVEGVTYFLRPWDVLIIPQQQIHRSIMHSSETYERMVLWIRHDFLTRFDEKALLDVFEWPYQQQCGLFRPDAQGRSRLIDRLREVERSWNAGYEGHRLLADTYLLQFLLDLRQQLDNGAGVGDGSVRSDPQMTRLISFINDHLSEDLSIERLAGAFFLSPSRLMHRFREHAGCTVHQYVLQKRLTEAAASIRQGETVTHAAHQAGFTDYSAFLRAFRKHYGCLPSEMKKV